MHTEIIRWKEMSIDDLVRFRQEVYLRSGRAHDQLQTWSGDRYDEVAFHVVTYSEQGEIIGAARLLEASDWTLERYFPYSYDKNRDVEIGRLGVSHKGNGQKGIFVDMLACLVQWCEERGYSRCYGLTVHRFILGLKRYGVPFDVVSPTVYPYGAPTKLLRFSVADLDKYVCDKRINMFAHPPLGASCL